MFHIALFGTSADPPTAGHQAILVWLSQRFDWVAVWAADNPFKSHQTPLEHREVMLRLLIEAIDSPQHNLSLEPELSHPRTIMTVELARQRWANADLTLVIGADLVPQLPRWYQIAQLLQQVKLLVVPRTGYVLENHHLQELQNLGATVTIADLSAPAVSSTAYRQHPNAEALPPPVEAYIHREQLYRWQDALPEKVTY
jgi:nicotinate-nucleotide adenylyltransferase